MALFLLFTKNSFGLPAKHVLVENIIDRAEVSAKLEDISKDAIRKEWADFVK